MYKTIFLILVGVIIVPINVFSQPPGEAGEFQNNDFKYELSASYEYGFDTDIDGGGSFSLNRYNIGVDLKKQIDRQWGISFDAGYTLTDYDFSGSGGFGLLDPWDKINKATAGFRVNYQLSRKWGVGAGPFIRFSGESGADFGDSLTYGGTLGFLYTPSRNFFAGAGVFISSRIEDDVLVVPGLLFNWQINEKLRLSSLLTGIRTELGPRVQMNYDIGNGFSTGLSVGYEFQRFRLDDEGIAVNGVGDIKMLPVWGSIYYNINRAVRLAFYGGAGFLGELELEDSSGDRIEKEDFDTLFFIGGGLRVNL